jgi:predicted permease
MKPLRPGILRYFHLRSTAAGDARAEVDEELQHHLDLLTERLEREGWNPAGARAEAARRFIATSELRSELYRQAERRDDRVQQRERWESVWQDLRYAARGLAREPLTTFFIVITLALGLGANLIGFGLVDRVFLRGPALVAEGSRLVRFFQHTEGPPFGTMVSPYIPYASYHNLAAQLTSVSGIGAYRPSRVAAGIGEARRTMRAVDVMGGYFPMLGVAPIRGRYFNADEDAARDGRLAVISAGLWRSDFASRSDIIGQPINVEQRQYTIVGVMPDGFTGAEKSRVDLWTLADRPANRLNNWLTVARLKPGMTGTGAGEEADMIHERTARDGPEWTWKAKMSAGSLLHGQSGRLSLEAVMAGWLGAISAIVLLIACANVINLLLARLTRRQRELAVRIALGAGRARVGRLLWIEGTLLALLSTAGAAIVMLAGEPVVRAWMFPDEGWKLSLVDPRLLLVLLGGILLTVSLFGVLPAMRLGEIPLASALRSGRGTGRFQGTLRSVLTAAQAALSVILLIGAGLFVRSQLRVNAVDLGIDARKVASPELGITLEASGPSRADLERDLYRRLTSALRVVPGVERVSYAVAAPLSGSGFSTALRIPGLDSIPRHPGGGPFLTATGPDYFATVGTALIEGREFTAAEREGSEPVAIVSATMARFLWPGRSPVGQCMHIGQENPPCARIVGVARDVHRNAFKEEIALQYYVPSGQERGISGSSLLIRTAGDPATLFPAIRATLLAADPAVRTVEAGVLSDALDLETRPLRLGMTAFGLSGGLAVFVALLGVYSLLSYMVAWRTHEIGVRMALGARQARVVLLVIRNAAALALVGVIIGSALTFLTAPQLEPFLYETSGRDPLVYAVVGALLLGAALLAGAVPAVRAVRISPTQALRAD